MGRSCNLDMNTYFPREMEDICSQDTKAPHRALLYIIAHSLSMSLRTIDQIINNSVGRRMTSPPVVLSDPSRGTLRRCYASRSLLLNGVVDNVHILTRPWSRWNHLGCYQSFLRYFPYFTKTIVHPACPIAGLSAEREF